MPQSDSNEGLFTDDCTECASLHDPLVSFSSPAAPPSVFET